MKYIDNSFPYITGNGFASRCSYVCNYDGFQINESQRNNWLFLKTDFVHEFFQMKFKLPDKLVVFTHNSDLVMDESYLKYLNDPRIVRWLAQNQAIEHPKLSSLPIGIANSEYAHGDVNELNHVRETAGRKDTLFYSYYTIGNNPSKRQYCLEQTGIPLEPLTSTAWLGFAGRNPLPATFPQYLQKLSRAYFCISPEGNGLDCHRTWEALYLGTIPVVTSNLMIEEHRKLCPMVVLEDWSQFRQIRFSPQLYQQIWGNFDVSRLYLDNYLAWKGLAGSSGAGPGS